ncbi:uncharacterized protein TNCV_3441081 [Trichonephila clavipes]|uniref:Uncharacterized protein n=1 Tax=Trichonephila clavipes TaxID=2585209 RepID=A0A8X7BED5_TRICX|nr:uncharacterized protein TNCV_3441081 [Trichonephila clavipes]
MAPRSRFTSGNTCGCRMSWTYHWADMVPRSNTRCDHVLLAMTLHTTTPAVGTVCHCKAKAGLRRSPRDLHTRTRLSSLLRLNLDSRVAKDDLLQSSFLVRGTTPNGQVDGRQGSARNGCRDPKCLSDRRLRMVRKDTEAPSEGATCAWMAADETVGSTLAFLTMWWSSRLLVCRGRPEPGFRVNDISRIHWSKHLLTIQSKRPN